MLRVPVDRLEPDMVLARPVPLPSSAERNLLPRHIALTDGDIASLRVHGITEVWIRHRSLEHLEERIDEEVSARQREVYANVRRRFEALMSGTATQLELGHFESSVAELFTCVRNSPSGTVLLTKLDSFDDYLLSHSANVCYLALLLGMKLEDHILRQQGTELLDATSLLRLLGLGCLLHDVGKMHLPREILNKPGKLTPAEMAVMQLHPVLGYEMVEGRIPPAAADIVLHHHQRYDGRGYPEWNHRGVIRRLGPLAGDQISILCRIATVCDVYDAATARRCYSPEKLPVQILHEMRTHCSDFFDPTVFAALCEIVPPFPIGQSVILSDGCEAVVVDFNPAAPDRPRVQVIVAPTGEPSETAQEIDLDETPDLHIVAAGGRDVRPFLQVPGLARELELIA
jgi:HD-GYP domain-containing protein (c-di-GMP phosphodiesterase class II)